jgi:HSP20 family protein
MATVLNELGRNLNRAWEGLTSGWRELMRGAANALTHYVPERSAQNEATRNWPLEIPSWGLLPGEVMETKKSIVVQIELPGVDRDDVEVTIEDGSLRVRGEKRADRAFFAESLYLRERAYGSFERTVPLPQNVDPDRAKASFRSGVLTVELPKTAGRGRRLLAVD